MKEITYLSLDKLVPFHDHPFLVIKNAETEELAQSIKEFGVMTPLLVRPIGDDRYEIISGHRRHLAAKEAGLETVPTIVCVCTEQEAIITMVDCNIQRENLLPSEKAFAYRMKLSAIKQQGRRLDLTSTQDGPKFTSAEVIGKNHGASRTQIQRYIRLTYLIPELLQMVDEKQIALTPAVELSYLTKEEQTNVRLKILYDFSTPSHYQARRMKDLSLKGKLSKEAIWEILDEEKPNQKEKIKIKLDSIKNYVPSTYSNRQIEELVIELIKKWSSEYQKK